MKTTKNTTTENSGHKNKFHSKQKSYKLSNGTMMNLFKTKNSVATRNGGTTQKNSETTLNNGALEPLTIYVAELLNNDGMATHIEGEIAHDLIVDALKQNRPIKISYKNLKYESSLFEKAAVGNLYKKFKAKKIEALVELIDATEGQQNLFQATIDDHKLYLKNPRRYRKAVRTVMGDM